MSRQKRLCICLNGPPRSGKDEIAKYLKHKSAVHVEKFSAPLKQAATAFFPERLLEGTDKDKALTDYGFMFSPRDFQILLSEKLIKPYAVGGIFGRLCATRILNLKTLPEIIVVADCGFTSEFLELQHCLSPNCKTVLWKISRPGCDFSNDSRSYLSLPASRKIHNDSSLSALYNMSLTALNKELEELDNAQ